MSTIFLGNQYLSWTGGDNTTYQTWAGGWSGDTTTNGYTYYPIYDPPYNSWTQVNYPSTTVIREIIKEKEVTKEMEQRSLFKVYVVDPRGTAKLLEESKPIIAENENQAMLKAGVATIAAQAGLELEQVDVYVQKIGTFIRPRKETQKVEVVKKEE